MDYSTPGFPVLHYLLEFAQTHVCWVGDAIQPYHPLPSPSPPALNLFQHQGLFQWVSSSHQVAQSIGASASASVLPVNIQGWFTLGLTGLISLQSKGLSTVLFSTIIWKRLFHLFEMFTGQVSNNWRLFLSFRKKVLFPSRNPPLWPLAESECQLRGGGEQCVRFHTEDGCWLRAGA